MPNAYVPDRGDLVWLEFTPQSGIHQAGKHPDLIMSPKAYNIKVGLALVCPVTSRIKNYPFEVRLPDDLEVDDVVLSDQLKSLDWRARKARLIDLAPASLVQQVILRSLPLLVPDR